MVIKSTVEKKEHLPAVKIPKDLHERLLERKKKEGKTITFQIREALEAIWRK